MIGGEKVELVYKITYHRMQDHYLPKLLQRIVSKRVILKRMTLFFCKRNLWK